MTGIRRPAVAQDLIKGGKLCIGDGYRAKNSELGAPGLPFARAGNINRGFNFAGADEFPIADLDRVGIKRSVPGDVVFTSKGTVGRFAFVRADTQPFVYSPQLCFWRSLDHNLLMPEFLFYWMHSRSFMAQVAGVMNQTDMAAYVSLRNQRKFLVDIPDLAVQRRIADILSAYDDLIENNNRQMALLEESIHLLYREWFVHLRFPGHERVAVVDGVPAGWAKGVIGDLLKLQRGYDITKKQQRPGPYPVVSSSGIRSYHAEFKVRGPGVVIGRKGTLGTVHYIDSDYWPHDTSLWVRDFRGNRPFYVLCLLRALDLARLDGGGANPSLNRNVVHAVALPIPPRDLIARFDDVSGPAFDQSQVLKQQNAKLREARDLLLPRLMDGRIPV